jgi:hypothetical protein
MSRKIVGQIILGIFCLSGAAKAMNSQVTCVMPFTKGSEGKFGEFKHLEAYQIPKLHNKGLKGKGYTVSIIENWADLDHPALAGKIELMNPMNINPKLGGGDSRSRDHGNHVSALIVGNKTDQFDGGVAPEAHGYIFWPKMEGTREAIESQVLELFRVMVKKSHIINLSGDIVKKGNTTGLSQNFLHELSTILEENDAVLIIGGTNKPVSIGDHSSEKNLVDLVSYSPLAKRVLIVGNLEYVNEEKLQKEYKYYNIWEKSILPLLETFKLDETKLKTHTKGSPLQVALDNQPLVNEQLRKHCLARENKKNSEIMAAYDFLGIEGYYFDAFYRSLDDSNLNKTAYVIATINKNKMKVPDDHCMTGKPTSAIAGAVKDHFILVYGTNIRSAWDSHEGYEKLLRLVPTWAEKPKMELYANKDGASQSVPITSGILILLHEHLYKDPHHKGSWGTLLETVKKSARKIGAREVFGLGVLDTTKLFPDVLVSHSKENL